MQVDASAKWPGLALFGSALFWLLLGGTLQLIAAIQLHTPTFLAECAWFTYGRLTPAAQNALVYGWGINAALGFGLWLMARLSATTLRHGGWLLVAIKFWNTGVALGVLGILGGYSTSFELLEMPRFVTLILLVSYAMIGVWAVTTFSIRNTENVFASQWYLFGAAFWFPWLYAIAQLMLLKAPVRGVLQPVVNAWFVHGLYGLWFVPVALAAAYYFLPKILGKPIANYYLAPLAFWWLVIVTALAGGRRLGAGDPPTLAREAIQIRRAHQRRIGAIGADAPVAVVVAEDDDDVRRGCGRGGEGRASRGVRDEKREDQGTEKEFHGEMD